MGSGFRQGLGNPDHGGSLAQTEERVTELPSKPLNDISVYELLVHRLPLIVLRKPQCESRMSIEHQNRWGGSRFLRGTALKRGKTESYAAAKRHKNPDAVRRIDPAEWGEFAPSNDPLQNLLLPRR